MSRLAFATRAGRRRIVVKIEAVDLFFIVLLRFAILMILLMLLDVKVLCLVMFR